jgi:MFS family permease
VLIRYLLAGALSLLGNAVAAIALPWLILVRTGDAATAGLVAAASAAPMLVAALAGGALVDRFGRRRTSVVADVASAACVAALPLVDAAWGLTVTAFVVLGVAGALADVPGLTAREALGPDVAAAAGVPLERLTGLREGVNGVVLVIGPAVAGGLLVLLDPVAVLWVTAATSLAAALVTATLPVGVGAGPEGPARRDLTAGWRVLRADRVLGVITLISTAGLLALGPLQGLLLPVHLVGQGSPGVFGLVVTALAIGGITGGVLYATLGARVRRRPVFVLGQLATAAGVVGMALLPPDPLLLGAALLAGLGSAPVGALVSVLVADRVPDEVRGRVLGLQNAAALGAVPVGLLGAGLLVEAIGLRPTGMLVAGVWLAATVAALAAPALRRLEVTGADHR